MRSDWSCAWAVPGKVGARPGEARGLRHSSIHQPGHRRPRAASSTGSSVTQASTSRREGKPHIGQMIGRGRTRLQGVQIAGDGAEGDAQKGRDSTFAAAAGPNVGEAVRPPGVGPEPPADVVDYAVVSRRRGHALRPSSPMFARARFSPSGHFTTAMHWLPRLGRLPGILL